MAKQQIRSDKLRQPSGVFSHATAIEAKGRLVFISGMTAIALISIRASGEVNLLTSTMVDAGSGSLKYSARTLWIPANCSMLRI